VNTSSNLRQLTTISNHYVVYRNPIDKIFVAIKKENLVNSDYRNFFAIKTTKIDFAKANFNTHYISNSFVAKNMPDFTSYFNS
jgi:hypothetical protein